MREFARCLGVFIILATPAWRCHAQDMPWLAKDAPYRAVVRLAEAAKFPDAGVEIELPEFGQTRADLGDVLLLDGQGQLQPLAPVWRGEGQKALLLAKALNPGEKYCVYFGGGSVRSMEKWEPKVSLLMETRRLPGNARLDSWPDMQKTWSESSTVDGAGFVRSIYHAGNPFGESSDFVTHYTGYLVTGTNTGMVLYTLSSDASFVLVGNLFDFGWPGYHSPWADARTMHSKKIACTPDFTRIDYFQAKAGGGESACVLGWMQNTKMEAIPPDAWLHPGVSQVLKIEDAHARPVPIAKSAADSYIGYGDRWFFDAKFFLRGAAIEGWNVTWQFDDGAVFSGTECQRIVVGWGAHKLIVKLQRGGEEVHGTLRYAFPDGVREASINNPDAIARYLELLAREAPERLSKETLGADLILLRDFAADGQIGKFASAWLNTGPSTEDPLWLPAQLSRIRVMAQEDPRKALEELRRINAVARKRYGQPFDSLELDILVFGLHDPSVDALAKRLAFENPNSEIERLAKVRVGDLYRLTGHYPQAVEQYQGVQKTIVDESQGRKLPAQDQAYSITISDLIDGNRRREALAKLHEWELSHPMAKFDSDYLLLRGRTLNAFGRWNESLAELDSFKKIQPDSPYVIDADFYRAQALDGLGRKEEARKIWTSIVTNYPKNELAEPSRVLAKKP
jgi:tetratricopeptide (TPR) repeat protein